jgi:hypothetical protein
VRDPLLTRRAFVVTRTRATLIRSVPIHVPIHWKQNVLEAEFPCASGPKDLTAFLTVIGVEFDLYPWNLWTQGRSNRTKHYGVDMLDARVQNSKPAESCCFWKARACALFVPPLVRSSGKW